MNEPNIPNPTSNPVRLVVKTAALAHHPHVDQRLRRAPLEGTQARGRPAAAANRPTIRGRAPAPRVALADPDQQRTRGRRTSSAAPTQSIFAGLLTGDSGTNRWVATIAITTTTSPSQKIHS